MATNDEGRDMGEEVVTKRTIKNWAARTNLPDELLTIEEAQLLATISIADRTLETMTCISDVSIRMQRIEIFLSRVFPNYQAEIVKALNEPQQRQEEDAG